MTRVAVVGTGIIGKRLVCALVDHPYLDFVGAVVRGPTVFVAARPELAYFATDADAGVRLRAAGVTPAGLLPDLLAATDVVVDCGPSRTGADRHATYRAAGVRVVYCGGERDTRLGPLVHPEHNPGAAVDAESVRLTSCNTTALARVVAAVGAENVGKLDATVVRCATDTDKAAKGITNGAVLSPRPSHHASDLVAVIPGLAARSVAMTVAMTAGHVIHARLRPRPGTRLSPTSRIDLRDGVDTISTAAMKAEVPRPSHNRYELVVQAIADRTDRQLDLWLYLDNQAITIPEALDVLQLVGGVSDPVTARSRTDRVLGLEADVVSLPNSGAVR